MASIASSPLVPIVTGLGAVALIFGTLSNGDIGGDDSAAFASSSSPVEEDPMAGGTGDMSGMEGMPDTTGAATEAVEKATLTAGKAATVGGLKMTLNKVTAKGATVTVGKKSYALTTKKAATIGKYTVTVTKVNTKAKRAAVSVEGS
jgi:hypothetical protein